MPSLKEYTMLFSMTAQLGSGFNSTFTKAQAAVMAMQKERTRRKAAAAANITLPEEPAIHMTEEESVVDPVEPDDLAKTEEKSEEKEEK